MTQRFKDDTPDELIGFTYQRGAANVTTDEYANGWWWCAVMVALISALLIVYLIPETVIAGLLK